MKHMASCIHCDYQGFTLAEICPKCGQSMRERPLRIHEMRTWVFIGAGMAILTTLGTTFLSALKSAHASADKSSQMSMVKQASKSMTSYLADHDDRFPPLDKSQKVATLLKTYLPNQSYFPKEVAAFTWNGDLSGLKAKEVSDPYSTWLVHTPKSRYSQVYTLSFVDGHGSWVDETKLTGIKTAKWTRTRSK